jgi:hypothetical protein
MMSHLEFVKGPELRRVILCVWSILLEGCIINNTTYFPALFSRSNKEIMKTASPDWYESTRAVSYSFDRIGAELLNSRSSYG